MENRLSRWLFRVIGKLLGTQLELWSGASVAFHMGLWWLLGFPHSVVAGLQERVSQATWAEVAWPFQTRLWKSCGIYHFSHFLKLPCLASACASFVLVMKGGAAEYEVDAVFATIRIHSLTNPLFWDAEIISCFCFCLINSTTMSILVLKAHSLLCYDKLPGYNSCDRREYDF